MEQELLPIFIAVILSAVMQVNLISAFAVVELTYKLIQLSCWFLQCSSSVDKHPMNTLYLFIAIKSTHFHQSWALSVPLSIRIASSHSRNR